MSEDSNTDINGSNLNGNSKGSLSTLQPKVYPTRWTQLLYLSLLALLSDWICFSLAANPSSFEAAYQPLNPDISAANLIDVFLFTNVASCCFVTDVVARFGLGRCIKGAGVLMTLGCLMRSGIPGGRVLQEMMNGGGMDGSGFIANAADVMSSVHSSLDIASAQTSLQPYPLLLLGTILVGFAQPYFQCTPPMLSATWFAPEERATATATALNFNQIGIALAFLVGGQFMAGDSTTPNGIHEYFDLITLVCALVTIGALIQFQDKPPTPPSYSEIEKLVRGEKEPPFLVSVQKLFRTPGFTLPLAAFICSISITNVVGTFIDEVMERGGITTLWGQTGVDFAGAGFEFAILLGGIVIGGYVDRTKQYKRVTMACLAATIFFVIPLGLTDHYLGNEPVLLVLALLGLGMACGPIQPINAELAVDVTYPSDETAVESVQQVGGNLVSALMVPVAEWALAQDYEFFKNFKVLDSDVRGDVILLVGVAVGTMLYFSGFDAELKRTKADGEGEEGGDVESGSVVASSSIIDVSVVDSKESEEKTKLVA